MRATISLILFSFLGLSFPDTDFLLFPLLSHRSIITHSIIVPFLIYTYFKKKKNINNEYVDLIYAGFLVGIGIHLIADLFPRAYIGYALIKLPFHFSIGVIPTIIWILLNIIFAFKIALDKSKIDLNRQINKILYFVSLTIITIIYFLSEYKPVTKIIFFLFSLVVAWIYLKINKKKIKIKNIKVEDKFIKKKEKEEKKNKKSGLSITVVIIFIIGIIIFGIFFIENTGMNNKNSFIEKKESYRSKNLYKDEHNLCSSELKKKYSKVKFTKIEVSDFFAPKDKLSYEKILNMWADYKLLMINVSWGKIDCKIKVNSDQSISFLELSEKY